MHGCFSLITTKISSPTFKTTHRDTSGISRTLRISSFRQPLWMQHMAATFSTSYRFERTSRFCAMYLAQLFFYDTLIKHRLSGWNSYSERQTQPICRHKLTRPAAWCAATKWPSFLSVEPRPGNSERLDLPVCCEH